MNSLSDDLANRCRTVLLKCDEFESNASLRAVFVTPELAPFRSSLSEADNRGSRVDMCLAFLMDKQINDGRLAFSFFLAVLRGRRFPSDYLYGELEDLENQVSQEPGQIKVVDIPFVILAMTLLEAGGLFNETVFDNPEVAPAARLRFRQFKEALEEHNITDLISHYGERREDWKPFISQEQTIYDLIMSAMDRIKGQASSPSSPWIKPIFRSESFFDQAEHAPVWRELRQLGCVMIIDAVSLFHPTLRQMLIQSGTSSNNQVAIFVFSPISVCSLKVNSLIEEEMVRQLQPAFERFHQDLDQRCEVGVGGERALQRWLYAIMPEELEVMQQAT